MKGIFQKRNSGFTLIEVLLVVSIIGMLSSVVIGSLGKARDKAVLLKTVAEMKSMQTAIEQYRLQYGRVPNELILDSAGNFAGGGAWDDDYDGNTYLDDVLDGLVNPKKYISKIPHAPKWPNNYNPNTGSNYFLGYMTYPTTVTATWGDAYYCGGKPILKYAIYFYANGEKLNLPQMTYRSEWDPGTVYDYYNGTEYATNGMTYCIAD